MKLSNTKPESWAIANHWCPFDDNSESDGTPARHRNIKCAGHDCAAWRWLLTDENQDASDPEGYCGAGGPI